MTLHYSPSSAQTNRDIRLTEPLVPFDVGCLLAASQYLVLVFFHHAVEAVLFSVPERLLAWFRTLESKTITYSERFFCVPIKKRTEKGMTWY